MTDPLPADARAHRQRKQPMNPAEDACKRCGGSMELTGGVPTDGTRICQLCIMEDWLDSEGM